MKKLLAAAFIFVLALTLPPASSAQTRRVRVQQNDYELSVKKLRADVAAIRIRIAKARKAGKKAEAAQLENQLAVLEARLSVHMRMVPPGKVPHMKPGPMMGGMRMPKQVVSLNLGYMDGPTAGGEISWPNMLSFLGLHKITGAMSKGVSVGVNYSSVNRPAGATTSFVSVYSNVSDVWVLSPTQIAYLSGGVNFPFGVTNNDPGKIGGQVFLGTAWSLGGRGDMGWLSADIGYVILRSNTVSSKTIYLGTGYHYAF